ncbi:MAG: Transcriptional regulator of heat shock protein [Candidatus Woesebacteria bacterium GW2011_GWB1_43_14]|uniref:Heat-inducible transcription repressor HrcA n=1 Tax=Candidatus Woesebacteria bacterium GW2011_GWB1_43_14 TaxID=1618578 RepID=A0A0G1DIL0_9BACT|nr:MAG: Transcriptional regulator of heat shock protein [Candidatus Woesebacteria bacterium GW2011_GWA1_39_11b]KKS77989.1 MAG: Transcriptional regulator of heat shock protein [Candidatus Woesebacteria bacterium GW2011_GWC1_42_9]KKS97432.1 MAG: Transcriptional regulator of heat shock protein [Candidatus Woesebacteria bacterium GW2011_GWB1_43_14]
MNKPLTDRQTQIIKALIDEYIETAEPVGSASLEKKYNLGISPATIRNEMVNLTKLGYLRQPHTSAGRTPTSIAMKFYINQLMDEKKMSVVDEVQAKEGVWDARENFDKLMDKATFELADKTKSLAVAATDDGTTWTHGHSLIFECPFTLDVFQNIFSILESRDMVKKLFFEHLTGLTPIEVIFGEELGWDFFDPVGIVATRFSTQGHEGAIGVIGPMRLNYQTVIPVVRYFRDLIQGLE